MKRGIALMDSARPEVIPEALDCFDRAQELRSRLPIRDVPVLRYGLAACWLNKADALIRLGDATRVSDALHAYDEGIALLVDLPFGEDSRFPRRLAIAHQNRGLALQTQGMAGVDDAVAAFGDAIAVLERDDAAAIPDRTHLLAVVWMNLANANAARGTDASCALARAAAVRAIDTVRAVEERDEPSAEVGLKARHILCHVMARHLSATSDGAVNDDVHETTDVVDEGLALARRWEQAGIVRFRGIAYDLFRFGARVYAIYQPQFLDEFVRDNLDPARSSADYVDSDEMRAAADEALGLRTRARS